ncbi:MAG: hypothetical protein ACFFD4_21365 [Candidatus Odinarchaeota archaeon]
MTPILLADLYEEAVLTLFVVMIGLLTFNTINVTAESNGDSNTEESFIYRKLFKIGIH